MFAKDFPLNKLKFGYTSTVSVVTITLNNELGLFRTLDSLANLKFKPLEVIIIDGLSKDKTKNLVKRYITKLNVVFNSEIDQGIYDAMNKGRALAKGSYIHYLNAGDYVHGEPYKNVFSEGLIPVEIHDNEGNFLNFDRVRLMGKFYCHQGIIFSAKHPNYNLKYKIASDFELISKVFSDLRALSLFDTGVVVYSLGGISSKRRWSRDLEILNILIRRKLAFSGMVFVLIVLLKSFLPNRIRWYLRRKLL
jgi:glycosyltransferase involved in cell wall biosynthesis